MAAVNLDKRKHPRYAVQVEAQLQAGGQSMPALTKDLSSAGICVVAGASVPPGSPIQLSLFLMLGSNVFSESLDLTGRVVWCTALGGNHQIGVVFTNMSPERAGYLEMFLRFLEQEILLGDGDQAGPEDRFDIGGEEDET